MGYQITFPPMNTARLIFVLTLPFTDQCKLWEKMVCDCNFIFYLTFNSSENVYIFNLYTLLMTPRLDSRCLDEITLIQCQIFNTFYSQSPFVWSLLGETQDWASSVPLTENLCLGKVLVFSKQKKRLRLWINKNRIHKKIYENLLLWCLMWKERRFIAILKFFGQLNLLLI